MRQYASIKPSVRRGELRIRELNLQDRGLLTLGMIAIKSFLFSILIGAFMMVVCVQIRAATATNLKNIVIVQDDILRIGDIFEQAGGQADIVIGRTPLPGKEMILDARTLMRIARSINLSWTPESALDRVVIKREATLVELSTIHDALFKELAKKGLEGNLDIVIQNTQNILPQMILPRSEMGTIEIKNLRYRPEKGLFEATLVSPSLENPLKTVSVNGAIYKRVMLPVLNTSLKAGDIIGASDLTYVDVRQRDLPKGTLLHLADIQGMSAYKPLDAGKPLRNTDIALPQLVSRGGFVTILYKGGGVSLSAKGKALQNGTRGELIRVVNLSSNKHLQGMVTADHQVSIY